MLRCSSLRKARSRSQRKRYADILGLKLRWRNQKRQPDKKNTGDVVNRLHHGADQFWDHR